MKTTKNITVRLVVSLACLMLASPAAYAMVAGRAQFVMGSVQITNTAGQTSALRKGDPVNEGDTLTSAKGANAQIRMQDGGYVAVRPDTRLKFDSFVFSGKEDGTEKSFFSLFKGGFRAVTGLIGRVNKPNYRITTPASTIGIRGTDHETYVVAPDSGFAPDVPKGTYNKVNVGETYMTTEKGTIFVKPNQMGFAGAADQMPELQPLNINIFTVADEPAPSGESGKQEDKNEDGEQVRETATVDNIAEQAEAHEMVPSSADFDTDEIIFPITTSDGTILAGATTVTEYAYLPAGVLIEISAPFSNMGWGNPMAAPSGMSYTGGGLSSYTDEEIVGGGSNTYTVIGGVSPITGAATSGATGIEFGRWTSVTALENTYTNLLGAKNGGAPTTWMYGPQGYVDAVIGVISGVFNYTLDGGTAPYDRQSGRSGTLTSASLTANFTLNTISANLALTLGTQSWSASATGMGIGGGQFFAGSSQSGSGSSPLGSTVGTLIVSMGTGTTPITCLTCFGSLSGAFTGQNYAGAILSYSLWDDNVSGNISGQAAFVRSAPITNGTPVPVTQYVVATANGDGGAQIQTVDAITLSSSGVLTDFSWGSATTPSSGYMSTTVTCTTCTVAAAPSVATTGINYGTWEAGSMTSTYVSPLSSFGTTGTPSPHWITGPESGPLFLPHALTGTKSFSFDGGMVTNLNGVAGTVLNTTTLSVDFTRQVVGINIDLTVPGALSGSHTWNAKTVAGDEAIINGSRGIGGATFRASSYNGIGPGFLTVTMDGITPGSGNVSGQLTGAGLNGAIMSYSLMAGASSFEQVNGVAALAGATSDIATPHREVMMTLTDSTSIIPLPVLGFYANAPSRMVTDGAGNLTQFDMNTINNGGKNDPSKTVTMNALAPPVLANAGNDPLTGISWGRWDGGSIDVTNRATGVVTPHVLAGSLHWIAGATETAAVTLPTTGTYTYINAGGTLPTDNLGAVGTLNSATLVADFSAQTVQVGVNVTVGAATLDAAAANVPIIQKTAFYADSTIPVGTAGHMAVTCTGTACGTSQQGTILGGFSGAGAAGATMVYGLQNNISAASTQVISGAAAFRK